MKLLAFDLVVHFGGAQRSTLELLQLAGTAVSPIVIDAYGLVPEYSWYARSLGIPYEVLYPDARFPRIGHAGSSIRRAARLAAALPELVRIRARLRAAVLNHDPAVIQVISPKAALIAASATRGLGIPLLYWSRGARVHPAALSIRMQRAISAYVCLSETTKAASLAVGAPADRTYVVPNAITPARLEALRTASSVTLPGPSRSIRLLAAATLLPTKGQDTLIRAVAKLDARGLDVGLYVAGDAPPGGEGFKAMLVELAHELGVANRVHFLGWRADIPGLLRSSTAFVLASSSEGMPRSVMEAMALGVPVIATPVGSVPEMLDQGVAGWMFDFGDVDGLADRLSSVVTDHEDRRRRVGAATRIVDTRFHQSTTRDSLSAVLTEIACRSKLTVGAR